MPDRTALQYEPPGTLPRPGPLGLLARVLLAVACGWIIWTAWALYPDMKAGNAEAYADLALAYLWGLWIINYIVNIGWGVSWGRWPQWTSLALFGLAVLAGYLGWGRPLAPPLALVTLIWMTYAFGHLGAAFIVQVILRSPGCEMQSLHHLAGKLKGRIVREHYCPVGFLQPLDNWEAGKPWRRSQ